MPTAIDSGRHLTGQSHALRLELLGVRRPDKSRGRRELAHHKLRKSLCLLPSPNQVLLRQEVRPQLYLLAACSPLAKHSPHFANLRSPQPRTTKYTFYWTFT